MDKAGNSKFTSRKLSFFESASAHTSMEHFKMLMEDGLRQNPKALAKYYNLKAQYDFKDNIPKQTLIVKTRDGISKEAMSDIRFGLLQFVTDKS